MTEDLEAARARLLHIVCERAYRDGVDIVLSSGKRSDFYVDGKRVTLHPEGLHLCARLMLAELATFPSVRAVGGLTLGADPIASAICALSHTEGCPVRAFLVRKEAKGHGTDSLIEGEVAPGTVVAIVEDTITTGASSLRAIDAVRAAGATVACVLALVDREDEEAAAFREEFELRPLFLASELREKSRGSS